MAEESLTPCAKQSFVPDSLNLPTQDLSIWTFMVYVAILTIIGSRNDERYRIMLGVQVKLEMSADRLAV